MKKIILFILAAFAAVTLAACGPAANTGTNNAIANANAKTNTNANSEKPIAAAPTKDALMAIEKQAWEAWKNKDAKFFEENMSDKYVGFGPNGRSDKAAAIKSTTDPKIAVKSYSLSDEQMTHIGADAAVLTFKATQDYTVADGKPGPKEVWSASVYVRDGDKWKNVFYNEVATEAPKAATAKPAPAAKPAAADKKSADAVTEALLASEKKGWEAWKNRDPKPYDDLLATDVVVLGEKGRFDKAATIMMWTEPKCEIKSYLLSDAESISLGKDAAILTFKGNANGACDGTPLKPDWGTSIWVRDGDAWKTVFAMYTPA